MVFLDDDAVALPGWLPALLQAYQDKRVLGVGGKIEPLWEAGFPAWFPSEFLWVVGCTYAGLPDHAGPVRNVIGANMSVRRDVAQSVGGFRSNLGRVGRFPLGGEETEFCIRTARHFTEHHWQYQPLAAVLHRVPPERATWRYFLTRCFAEGLTKARVSRATGTSDGLASERQHVARTLPLAVLREIGAALRGHPAALGRAVALVTGTLSAGVGYLVNPLIERREQAGMARPTTSSSFEPVRVMEVSLDEALPQVLPRNPDRDLAYRRAQVLVKLHDAPLGMVRVSLPEAGLSADQLAALIWQALGQEINRHLRQDGLPPINGLTATGLAAMSRPACLQTRASFLQHAPPVSVIVATRNRAQRLPELLQRLLTLDYPEYEVVIVDNAPADDSTHDLVTTYAASNPTLRYVYERRPGLSQARNTGVRSASHNLLAITDDDVLPDPHWLTQLVLGFDQGEHVGCVTGGILARRLETPAQVWIEQYGGFNKGFQTRLFDLGPNRDANRMYPYAAGLFGSGANIALRRSTWEAVGGFDPALGAGTRGMGGEDLALFVDVLQSGRQIVYQPSAFLYHDHHESVEALRRQMYGYGVGLTAYLTRTIIQRPTRALDMARKAPAGLWHALHPASSKNRHKDPSYPEELTHLERRGMLYGPLAYLRSRRVLRRYR